MTTTTAGNAAATPRPSGFVRAMLLVLAGSLAVLALLPFFVLFDISVTGWAIGAAAVLANAVLHSVVAWFVRDASVTVTLGAMGFSMIFRAGLTALMLFFVGAELTGAPGDRPIGMDRPDLARIAIVVFLIGFSIDAFIDTIRRAAQRDDLAASTPGRETPA